MDLKRRQEVLFELYLDDRALKHFKHDPQGFGKSAGLSGADLEWLSKLDFREIEEFAHGLRLKRCGEMRQQLPALSAALGRRFEKLFLSHARIEGPNPSRHPAEAAARFVDWICESRAGRRRRARAAILIWASFEAAQLQARRRRFMVRVFGAALDLPRFREEGIHRCGRGWTLVIWWRWKRTGVLQRKFWALNLKRTMAQHESWQGPGDKVIPNHSPDP